MNILAVGDVVSEGGLDYLERSLRRIRRERNIHFTVVNGENASGVGVTAEQARRMLDAGADVITLGNHTWGKIRITDMLDASPYLLRPANFSKRVPGRGWGVYDGPQGLRIGVVNLIGRVSMDPNPDNPFTVADQVLAEMKADVILVDFHAEATSEKLAMGWYLDGRASAKGTGYITDLGMTGPARSILGIRPELSINKFLGGLPRRYEAAEGPCKLEAAVFTVDTKEKRCLAVRQLLL